MTIRACAWCKSVMGEKPPLEDKTISHGICFTCEEEQMKQFEERKPGHLRRKKEIK